MIGKQLAYPHLGFYPQPGKVCSAKHCPSLLAGQDICEIVGRKPMRLNEFPDCVPDWWEGLCHCLLVGHDRSWLGSLAILLLVVCAARNVQMLGTRPSNNAGEDAWVLVHAEL